MWGLPAPLRHTGKHPQRHFHEQWPPGRVGHLAEGDALVPEQAVDQRVARFGAAGAHAGAGHGLDLVDVPIAAADQVAHLAGRHPLAPAHDGVIGDALDVVIHRLG